MNSQLLFSHNPGGGGVRVKHPLFCYIYGKYFEVPLRVIH
jgi:hypothetical protein